MILKKVGILLNANKIMKNYNLKELTKKELSDINGGGFFEDLGVAVKTVFCDCIKIEYKVNHGTGSKNDFYNNSGGLKY